MAGRKRKPCDFCEDEWFQSEEGKDGHQCVVEIYPVNNFIGITSFAVADNGETDEIPFTLEMNYCPACGRKLN